MKKIVWLMIIVLAVALTGCAADIKKHNDMVQQANRDRQEHMATALSNAKTSEAVVAMSILFAVGAGQQTFVKPDTPLDYMRASLPIANLFMQGFQLYKTADKAQPTYNLEGAGNTMYVTNEKNSRNTSTLNRDSFNTHSEDFWQAGNTIGDAF